MARQPDEPAPGLLLVDKPAGWTSHDVVARVRRIVGTRKIGHAGTLDPMATGLLVLAVGRATRLLTYVTGHGKSYNATLRLGQSTVTDDAEGDVISTADASGVTDDALAAGIAALTGDISQVPSAVSAIKVDGQRSYARVRAGEQVELAARPVTVSRFDILAIRREGLVVDLDVVVDVTAGTYIRALARDLGASLGVGGHLTALRRTSVGRFDVGSAATVDALAALSEEGQALPLMGLDDAATAALPVLELTAEDARNLSYGKPLRERAGELTKPEHDHDFTHDAVAIDPAGVAIAVVRRVKGAAKPVIVFAPAEPHT